MSEIEAGVRSSGRPESDCPTITVTKTQYAATVTSTIDANSQNSTSAASSSPSSSKSATTIRTITLIPSGLVTTHNSTTPSLNSTLTIPAQATSLSLSLSQSYSHPTPPSSSSDSHTDSAHQAGRVAGGVLGSLAGLALLIFLLAWCCKRKTQIKMRLQCGRRQTKDEKEGEEDQKEMERVEHERAPIALPAVHSKPGGGLLHSGLSLGPGGQLPAMSSSSSSLTAGPGVGAAGRYYASPF